MMRPGEFPPPSQMKAEDVQMGEPTQEEQAILDLQMAAHGLDPQEYNGLKFEEPPMPQDKLPRAKYHMRYRYDEGVSQLTKLLMRHGKLGKAQNVSRNGIPRHPPPSPPLHTDLLSGENAVPQAGRVESGANECIQDMAMVLNYLRTSPAPKLNPQRALLPGAPPPEHLPLNPELYLMLAVDSVAPLVRLRGFAGLAGGGKALEIPVPMSKRSRRREAFAWIMETVNKKHSMGSGKKQLAHRIGEEIVAVVEGKSAVWGKRDMRHKLGTSVRANLNSPVVMKKGLS